MSIKHCLYGKFYSDQKPALYGLDYRVSQKYNSSVFYSDGIITPLLTTNSWR